MRVAVAREVRPGELAMVGPLALAGIAAMRFDTVVLGCCGVSPEGHVMAHDLGDAAVKQALITQYHITSERLSTDGFGASRPVDTNDTLAGRARNRRVELTRQ